QACLSKRQNEAEPLRSLPARRESHLALLRTRSNTTTSFFCFCPALFFFRFLLSIVVVPHSRVPPGHQGRPKPPSLLFRCPRGKSPFPSSPAAPRVTREIYEAPPVPPLANSLHPPPPPHLTLYICETVLCLFHLIT
ncbi:hypothetical protein IscW_ISCW006852, partial [Ixodes scapularis]